jgi:dihydrofolate reductase
MSKVISHLTISLDGFLAGPNQSLENPLGEGAMKLHEWLFATPEFQESHSDPGDPGASAGRGGGVDSEAAASMQRGIGAVVMGRNMFAAGRGEWDLSWRGWWGENPPFHTPVFVLTHYAREPIEMEGGTTFSFVTEGAEAALERARAAAGDLAVHIAGGASTVRQYLRARLLDELHLHVAPLLLGRGERLFEDLGDCRFEVISAAAGSPLAAHVSLRVLH